MRTKRVKEMVPLEREIISMIWKDIAEIPNDGLWRKYKRDFTFDGKKYTVTCRIFYDSINFIYKDMVIVGETKTILLDPMDFVQ